MWTTKFCRKEELGGNMQVRELTDFYNAIREDNRITTTHISLYMALFELWNGNDFHNPIQVTGRKIMEAAKISGLATFHKCIRDLDAFSYILYMPSRNPAISSMVNLKKL
jgi:hypothetical protein